MPAFCIHHRKYHTLKKAVELHGCSAMDSPFIPLLMKAFEMGRERDLEKRREEKGTDEKQNMYLSDSIECMKALVNGRRNVPPTNPPDIWSLMNFKVGEYVQAGVTEVLANLGGELIEEAHLEVEFEGGKASGRSDVLLSIPREVMEKLGLADHPEVQDDNLLEIKATGERSMVTMISNGKEGQDSHRRQCNRYAHASQLGKMPNGKVYGGTWLTYFIPLVPKGEPNIFPFYVPYNEKQALGDLEFLAEAEWLAASGVHVPVPEFLIDRSKGKPKLANFPCHYCSWQGGCEEEIA